MRHAPGWAENGAENHPVVGGSVAAVLKRMDCRGGPAPDLAFGAVGDHAREQLELGPSPLEDGDALRGPRDRSAVIEEVQ
eukprot:15210735-Alexandrium_andersonii.AAC.1